MSSLVEHFESVKLELEQIRADGHCADNPLLEARMVELERNTEFALRQNRIFQIEKGKL